MIFRVKDSNRPPYNAVGLLRARWTDNTICRGTGALIASDLVLTCAHILIDQKPRTDRATDITFYPGWNSTSSPSGGLTASKWVYCGWFQDGQDAWDVGLVKLETPAIGVTYFFTPQSVNDKIAKSLEGESLKLAGYPGNHDGEMWEDDDDDVSSFDLATNTVIFTHSTHVGSSGSPLYTYESVSDVVPQYAVHNSQNIEFGIRRGLLITTMVHKWIRGAIDILNRRAVRPREDSPPQDTEFVEVQAENEGPRTA